MIKQHPEILNKNKNLNKQIEKFIGILEKDETSFKLRDVNLVFFPIIAHDHYYVIVFNLDKGQAVILDNSDSDADYDGKYKKIFDFVVSYVCSDLYLNTFILKS